MTNKKKLDNSDSEEVIDRRTCEKIVEHFRKEKIKSLLKKKKYIYIASMYLKILNRRKFQRCGIPQILPNFYKTILSDLLHSEF